MLLPPQADISDTLGHGKPDRVPVFSAGGLSGVFSSRAPKEAWGTPRSRTAHPAVPKGAGAVLGQQAVPSRDNLFCQPRAANLPTQASSFHPPPLGTKIQFCVDPCEAWSQFWKAAPDVPCKGTGAHSNHQLFAFHLL